MYVQQRLELSHSSYNEPQNIYDNIALYSQKEYLSINMILITHIAIVEAALLACWSWSCLVFWLTSVSLKSGIDGLLVSVNDHLYIAVIGLYVHNPHAYCVW